MAALYALVLQAVLGGFVVAQAADPAHILCLQDAGSGDAPSKPAPAHDHRPCCIAAHVLGTAGPPLPASFGVAWPLRRTVPVRWRPEVVAAPRAPPGISASARAPPVV